MKIEAGVQLGRYTTLGAGGEARAFAKPSKVEEVEEALAWARERELPIVTIGSSRSRAQASASSTSSTFDGFANARASPPAPSVV